MRPNDMKCSRLCALGARLVMHRFRDYAQLGCCGASFFLPPSPRCAQDVRIVSPLIQAVSAHCFLFKHKSHRLTLNCRCLSPPAGEHSIVAFIKSQELCTFKINECASLDANNMWTHNFVRLFFFKSIFKPFGWNNKSSSPNAAVTQLDFLLLYSSMLANNFLIHVCC